MKNKLKIFAALALTVAMAAMLMPQIARAEQPSFSPLDLITGLEATAGADIEAEYSLGRIEPAAYGAVYKFEQHKGEFSVPDGEIVVMVGRDGKVLSTFGEYCPVPEFEIALTLEQAEAAVDGEVLSTGKTIYKSVPSYEIVTTHDGGFKYIVSAENGEILYAAPQSGLVVKKELTDYYGNKAEYNVERGNLGTFMLQDTVRNITVMNARNSWGFDNATYYTSSTCDFEPIAVSTYANVIKAYDFYADEKNIGVSRLGIDGNNDDIAGNSEMRNEIEMYIMMHFGVNFENAACQFSKEASSAMMIVGDGNERSAMYQPGRATDVISHEYQHAITTYIAGLGNTNEEGALGEAISDIFGSLVEGHDLTDDKFWRIGEDIVTSRLPDLRNMIGGTAGQAYNISERMPNCDIPYNVDVPQNSPSYHDHSTCDFGGVHANSTIFTHAQYLMCQKLPEFFTKETIGTLWYNTLLTLSTGVTFDEFALKFLQTAIALGYNEEQLEAVHYGLREVGIEPTCTVTFVDENGETIETQEVPYGCDAVMPEPPAKPSDDSHIYEFAGWDVKAENVTEDMTVTATYSSKQRYFTVRFLDNDGNQLKSDPVENGSTLELPDAATLIDMGEKYIFDGWYLDEARTIKAQSGATVEADMTVYGKWIEDPTRTGCASCGTVTFGAGGGGMWLGLGIIALAIVCTPFFSRKKAR